MVEPGQDKTVPLQINRRKEPRFVVVGVALFTPKGRKLMGEVLNLSSSGILLLSKEFIAPGQALTFQMSFPPLLIQQEDIEVDVYTVWSDEQADGNYKTGMLVEPRPGQAALFERALNILGE